MGGKTSKGAKGRQRGRTRAQDEPGGWIIYIDNNNICIMVGDEPGGWGVCGLRGLFGTLFGN